MLNSVTVLTASVQVLSPIPRDQKSSRRNPTFTHNHLMSNGIKVRDGRRGKSSDFAYYEAPQTILCGVYGSAVHKRRKPEGFQDVFPTKWIINLSRFSIKILWKDLLLPI